jgi:cytochrome c5
MVARKSAACSGVLLAILLSLPFAAAQDASHRSPGSAISPGFRFSEMSGAELFAGVCQGCHMPDAKGATGAGTYPSLANNGNLAAGGYPVTIVVRGLRGMPAFGGMMSDDQVAAVVNYVRTNFGNAYRDTVTAEDVRSVRP